MISVGDGFRLTIGAMLALAASGGLALLLFLAGIAIIGD